MLHLFFILIVIGVLVAYRSWCIYCASRDWRTYREEREREDEPHGFGHVDDGGGAA